MAQFLKVNVMEACILVVLLTAKNSVVRSVAFTVVTPG